MKYKNIISLLSKKYMVIVTLLFILLCILSILNEVIDLPHLILRAPSTPANWKEIIIEIIFFFLIWLITAFILRKFESKHQQTEEALRENEERLSLTLETTGLGLWDQNFKTNKIIRNERWAEMLGYKLTEIDSNIEAFNNLIHPDDLPQFKKIIKDHETGKTNSFRVEHRMKTKTGEWKWILNWGKITDRDKDGSPVRALGTHLDITGDKQTEEELHRLSKDREEIFQALGNATIIIDPEFNIIDINRLTIEATGKSKDELLGKKCYEIFHGTKRPYEGCPAEQIITSAHYVPIEKEIPALGGTFIVACTPVLNNSEHLVKIIHSATNITGRKQAEEELKKHRNHLEELVKERTKQFEESNAELETFAYTVSHDLRAPLRAMYGLAQALNEDYANKLDAEGKEYAQRIINSSEYMDTMIRDLLEYSKLSIIELELKPVQLEQSIKQSMKQIKMEIKQSNAEINIKTPLPEVIGHYSVINQILSNILTNSIKFVKSEVKPKVKIWAEEKNEWVYLYIKDNGIGIAPENHEKIFNVFERLHGIETYPGTGIGLAIVKKGMERMVGKVDVESEIGKGSIFIIKLKKIL